jgi:hypothetical protein
MAGSRANAARPGGDAESAYACPTSRSDRVERVIAVSRVVRAISALPIMLWIAAPDVQHDALYVVLGAYIVYSVALLWLFTGACGRARAPADPGRGRPWFRSSFS